MTRKTKKKIALFLGSGFSAALGLPTTTMIRDQLLLAGGSTPEEIAQESFVCATIGEFWKTVFGWCRGAPHPSLEDHFTMIDLAANTGHCLGQAYGPKELRAIRRMTIHRVFELLRPEASVNPDLDRFLNELIRHSDVTFVTTNWDLVVERLLERLGLACNHGEGLFDETGGLLKTEGTPILKLHGSLDFGYCDSCRALVNIQGLYGDLKLYLDPNDLKLFPGGEDVATTLPPECVTSCFSCQRRWSGGRLATFSYRKDLAPAFLQKTWDEAYHRLRVADQWLAMGYSLPEADVEIRQLLKSAQLAKMRLRSIDVITLPGPKSRYEQFFGAALGAVEEDGLEAWVQVKATDYVRAASA